MIRHSAALTAAILFVLSSSASFAETKAGESAQMQHFKVKYVEPKLPPDSFGAQPKEYWRVGTKLGRVLEAEDTKQHMHQLLIVNPPDLWAMELISKQGKHVKVPPTEAVRFAIFPGRGPLAQKIMPLEYGTELEFFKSHGAKKTTGEKYNGHPADKYEVQIDKVTLTLFTDPKTDQPLNVALFLKDNNKKLAVEYITYATTKIDPDLFKPPAGLKMVDLKPPSPDSKGTASKPTGTIK